MRVSMNRSRSISAIALASALALCGSVACMQLPAAEAGSAVDTSANQQVSESQATYSSFSTRWVTEEGYSGWPDEMDGCLITRKLNILEGYDQLPVRRERARGPFRGAVLPPVHERVPALGYVQTRCVRHGSLRRALVVRRVQGHRHPI